MSCAARICFLVILDGAFFLLISGAFLSVLSAILLMVDKFFAEFRLVTWLASSLKTFSMNQ